MIPFVSGAKVASVALSGLGKTYEFASGTAELPGRAMKVLDDVEAMVTRVGVLVGRMERIATEASRATAEAVATVEQAKALNVAAVAAVAGATEVAGEARAVVARTAEICHRAERAVAEAERTAGAAGALLRTYEPIAAKAAPLAEKFVDSLSPAEVDAAIRLVDELPRLTEHLRSDIMPILATLDRVGPDIHELLEVTYDVRRAILGIPGFGFFKKRGEDILEEAEHEAQDRDGASP